MTASSRIRILRGQILDRRDILQNRPSEMPDLDPSRPEMLEIGRCNVAGAHAKGGGTRRGRPRIQVFKWPESGSSRHYHESLLSDAPVVSCAHALMISWSQALMLSCSHGPYFSSKIA